MAEEHGGSTNYPDGFWERLERKYSLAIEANKATASIGGKRVAAVTAILGTDEANLLINFGPSTSVSTMKIKALQKFTASNLAAELKETCLFILAQMEMAQG